MNKRKQFLYIILFFLLINNIISSVNAIDYGIGVYQDQEITWKCSVCNQMEMELIFGSDWNDSGVFNNLSIGKRMKWKINNVELNPSFSKINFSIWYWTSEEIWGIKDNDSEIAYTFDSMDTNYTRYTSLVPFWFPVPVGEFMGNLALNEWYDVDNRVLPTLNVEIESNAISIGFPLKNIKIIAIYNDQGILNTYKLYTTGNVVIMDISLDFLPFYVLPTLIGLIFGLSVGLGLFIYKKRRSISK